MIDRRSSHILIDTWYANYFEDIGTPLERVFQAILPQWLIYLANHIGIIRGLLFFWLCRDYQRIVTNLNRPGSLTVIILSALFSISKPRQVLLLEFIRGERPKSRIKRLIYPLWTKLIIKPALQRTMVCAHVLTTWERDHYAHMYGIQKERFVYIPWPQRRRDDVMPSDKPDYITVLSSGRWACDWDTLFKAAEGCDWPLKIICGRHALPHVKKLNLNKHAEVLCEVPRSVHQENIQAATVYVLCLQDVEQSQGQIRIMNAIQGGTPIVATSVKGINGYIINGVTGVLVQPGDHIALRNAIEGLLADAAYRVQLAQNAFKYAGERTFEQYIFQIKSIIINPPNA